MSENPTDHAAEGTPPLKDGGQSFGSFFPQNYVLGVFQDVEAANGAGAALVAARFAPDDVIVAAGPDVADHDAAVQAQQGLLTKLGEKWSRLYTDEAADAEALMQMARRGAAFVLAYAPDDESTQLATEVIKPFRPDVFRKYEALRIIELGVEV